MDTQLLTLLFAFALGGLLTAYLYAVSRVSELEQNKEELEEKLEDAQAYLHILEERFRNYEEFNQKNRTSWFSMLWKAIIHFFL